MKNIHEQGLSLSGSGNLSERTEHNHTTSMSKGLGNLQPRDGRGQLIDLITGRPFPTQDEHSADRKSLDNSDDIGSSPYITEVFSRNPLPGDTGVYARVYIED